MFRRLVIPTPFQVGPVNAYLAGRTLVDPGPASEEAWATLQDELEAGELAPADVERVLVTHPHPDHFGLARRFREDGADVLASPGTAAVVRDFEDRFAYEQAYFVDCFERHGMARKTAETVTKLPEAYLEYAPSVAVDRELAPGDVVVVDDVEVEALSAEGHAPGERIFAYAAGSGGDHPTTDGAAGNDGDRHAIVGDHVLPDITPNPLLQPPPESGAARPRVLPSYNESLARLRDGDFDRFRPGHREDVADPAGRVDDILAAHERRTAEVLELLDGPTTAVEVMEGLFGDLPVTEYFPGMSEAVGHLDVLEARGEVTRQERGGIVVYEPTGGGA